jgi:hypothetical protein
MPASKHMLVIGKKRRKAARDEALDRIFPAERADFLDPGAWALPPGGQKSSGPASSADARAVGRSAR